MENLCLEKVKDKEFFNIFKIRKSTSDKYIIAALFKQKKVNKAIIEELNSIIDQYNKEAIGLFLDVSVVDSISPDILVYNVDMIKNLENGSTIQRVGICAGKFATMTFNALLKLKKPKIETRIFSKEDEALNFALNIHVKK